MRKEKSLGYDCEITINNATYYIELKSSNQDKLPSYRNIEYSQLKCAKNNPSWRLCFIFKLMSSCEPEILFLKYSDIAHNIKEKIVHQLNLNEGLAKKSNSDLV